jgi:hypothetical protein
MVFCSILVAGCIQLPGMHILSNTPDPVVGQWIAGDPPATDLHLVFYENQTFLSVNFFMSRGEEIDRGNWTKISAGRYALQSAHGGTSYWMYDPFIDSIYMSGLPQLSYHRYTG